MGVSLPQGLARDRFTKTLPVIGEAFGARSATLRQASDGPLVLRLDYGDSLAHAFSLDYGMPWDGRAVSMGRTNTGEPWMLKIGPHPLVAGASGSGKASLVWGLLLGLAAPIRDGLVEVWGIDRKGGMELAFGQAMLTRFAASAEESIVLLEEAVAAMQACARQMAGTTRQHQPTLESPLTVLLIDELAALTSYETDCDLLRRANVALATLASQGRAVGFVVFACLQDPRRETLPARGLFTQTVGLRLRDATETAMVLGDGAAAAGALCHTISPETPGMAYILPDDGNPPQHVRAGLITDDMIRDAARRFPAPRQVPVVVPEPPVQAPRPRRPRATSRVRKDNADT